MKTNMQKPFFSFWNKWAETIADRISIGVRDVRFLNERQREGYTQPEEDDSLCGDPSNHDGGETDGCAECGALRLNI